MKTPPRRATPRRPHPDQTRRRLLAALVGTSALAAVLPFALRAEDSPADPGEPFSFERLSARMQAAAAVDPPAAEPVQGFLADLTYEGYKDIAFRPDHARWQGAGQDFRVQAFHLGWLFDQPVHIFEVVDGTARPMVFSTADFEYRGDLAARVPTDTPMPGVAGFRLHTPLNRADVFDELVAFLGASYFRALGRGTVYGLSARGLAVNTAMSGAEEFPRFSDFWLERPADGAGSATICAALESPSVTGAYRFAVTPGEATTMEVTARLFLRRDIEQLGVAPLTSMFLFGGADPDETDDFREAVHDSEYLVVNTPDGETQLRALNNPPRLGTSYLGMPSPLSFGLIQRSRDFRDYLDAEAHYERRPSLIVEPIGDWGQGTVRLIEIPSDFEGNDNIVAYWVPEAPARAGDALEFRYRLSWGLEPPGSGSDDRARVLRTRAGIAGVAGAEADPDSRKFVIDFSGGLLGDDLDPSDVQPEATAQNGEIVETVFSRIDGTDTWRLVLEARGEAGTVIELRAWVSGFGRVLTETWLYQWVRP